MSDEPIATHSFCVVAGCTGHATTARWITVGEGEQQQVEVCWKHEDNALTMDDLDSSKIDWTGGGGSV